MSMIRKIVLGGPGTGKTHRLIDHVQELLEKGVAPNRIAFVAFTRQAAYEAKERIRIRLNLSQKDLPYFRTLHSFCFRELAVNGAELVKEEALSEFADVVNEEVTGFSSPDAPPMLIGDRMLAIDHYARTTMTSLENAHRMLGEDVEWFRLKRFVETYRAFKADRFQLDFTDLLTRYLEDAAPAPVDVAIVDEAQDLTLLQWTVIDRAFSSVKELIIAGDDDQGIYAWSGAATDHFLGLPYEREVLPASRRLSAPVFNFAQDIIGRVGRRFHKETRPGPNPGKVEWVARPDDVDYGQGTWLILARTRYLAEGMAVVLREAGVTFTLHGEPSVDPAHVRAIQAHEALRKGWRIEGVEAALALRSAGVRRDIDERITYTAKELDYDPGPIWHDALVRIPARLREYYLACRRRGEPLQDPPRIRVSTIHGAKGAEAERVLLLTDSTYRVQREYERKPDNEHRVFYVGATRAASELYVMSPRSIYGYRI